MCHAIYEVNLIFISRNIRLRAGPLPPFFSLSFSRSLSRSLFARFGAFYEISQATGTIACAFSYASFRRVSVKFPSHLSFLAIDKTGLSEPPRDIDARHDSCRSHLSQPPHSYSSFSLSLSCAVGGEFCFRKWRLNGCRERCRILAA